MFFGAVGFFARRRTGSHHSARSAYQKVGKLAPAIKGCDPIQWPVEVSAPKGAPNVLLVMTDDVGFGATTPFGGPIPTATYERLAKKRF